LSSCAKITPAAACISLPTCPLTTLTRQYGVAQNFNANGHYSIGKSRNHESRIQSRIGMTGVGRLPSRIDRRNRCRSHSSIRVGVFPQAARFGPLHRRWATALSVVCKDELSSATGQQVPGRTVQFLGVLPGRSIGTPYWGQSTGRPGKIRFRRLETSHYAAA
jgi:hypothetical protein